jgi:hypothetical protein
MNHECRCSAKALLCAVTLLCATPALAEGLETRTTAAVALPDAGDTNVILLSQSVQPGTWLATAKASVVSWGRADYVRCYLMVEADVVDGSTTMIGQGGGAPAVATLQNQKLFRIVNRSLVHFACLHDEYNTGEYVDPGASLVIAAVPPALPAGTMMLSDTDPSLAVKPDGGAQNGAVLKLVSNCFPGNPECSWSYRNGMIVSDANPNLAVRPQGSTLNGATLKLSDSCSPSNRQCTWSYRNGQFLSDSDHGLVISAFGGAQNGATLKLAGPCTASNTDCTWTNRN